MGGHHLRIAASSGAAPRLLSLQSSGATRQRRWQVWRQIRVVDGAAAPAPASSAAPTCARGHPAQVRGQPAGSARRAAHGKARAGVDELQGRTGEEENVNHRLSILSYLYLENHRLSRVARET